MIFSTSTGTWGTTAQIQPTTTKWKRRGSLAMRRSGNGHIFGDTSNGGETNTSKRRGFGSLFTSQEGGSGRNHPTQGGPGGRDLGETELMRKNSKGFNKHKKNLCWPNRSSNQLLKTFKQQEKNVYEYNRSRIIIEKNGVSRKRMGMEIEKNCFEAKVPGSRFQQPRMAHATKKKHHRDAHRLPEFQRTKKDKNCCRVLMVIKNRLQIKCRMTGKKNVGRATYIKNIQTAHKQALRE